MVLPTYTGDNDANINQGPNGETLSKKPIWVGSNFADYVIAGNAQSVSVFDDFLGPTVNNLTWNKLTGSDGSCANAINSQAGGVDRITSGAGATHTMAVNGAQTVGERNFLASKTIQFEAKLGKISALTSQSICFGLVDATTLTAPFTVSAGTVTANGTNGVAFVQDSGGTNTHLNAVSVLNGGTPQVTTLTNDVDTAAFHAYRIEVDASGNAIFYIDGAQVASITAAVQTTARLAPSVGMFSNATSASQTLDIDYIYCATAR